MTKTLEMLGFEPDARVLIVHADDVGVSHASNVAAFECMERGSLSCASALVPAPWFAETVTLCKRHPGTDMGIHLTLTAECETYRWRSLTAHPSLHAPDGGMWRSVPEVLRNVGPDAAREELRAQVRLALDMGVDVTHVDTHMGTVMQPKYLPVYADIALEFRLPIFFIRPSERRLASLGDAAVLYAEQTRRLEEAGIPLLDNVIVETLFEVEPEDKERQFKEWFANLRPGLTHFLCHPAVPCDEIEAMSPGDCRHRAREYELFRTPMLREWAESHGVRIIGYREIRDRMRAAG